MLRPALLLPDGFKQMSKFSFGTALALAGWVTVALAESAAPRAVQVPEPAMLALLGIGLLAVAVLSRRGR